MSRALSFLCGSAARLARSGGGGLGRGWSVCGGEAAAQAEGLESVAALSLAPRPSPLRAACGSARPRSPGGGRGCGEEAGCGRRCRTWRGAPRARRRWRWTLTPWRPLPATGSVLWERKVVTAQCGYFLPPHYETAACVAPRPPFRAMVGAMESAVQGAHLRPWRVGAAGDGPRAVARARKRNAKPAAQSFGDLPLTE